MRIRDKNEEEEAPINLMPLIDMVFLLLIFFLVATTFAQEERDLSIQLPATAVAQSLSAQPQELIINIDHEGAITLGGEQIDRETLRERLGNVARDDEDRKVLLRADRESKHKHFADVAAMAREQGINPLNIGYIFDKTRPVAVE